MSLQHIQRAQSLPAIHRGATTWIFLRSPLYNLRVMSKLGHDWENGQESILLAILTSSYGNKILQRFMYRVRNRNRDMIMNREGETWI